MEPVPLEVFEDRANRARQVMEELGVDGMQLTGRENYHYLSGDVRNVARMLLPVEADPILIVFYTEVEFASERSWVKDVRGWSTPAELRTRWWASTSTPCPRSCCTSSRR